MSNETSSSETARPEVWVVVLGYNHGDDTIECLRSIERTRYDRLRVLYVDNGSEEAEARRVVDAVPGMWAVRHPANIGVARGFNSGLTYACRHGADCVIMANNDTTFHEDAVAELVDMAMSDPSIGIVAPKIFYYDHPASVWAAGSRFRSWPPAIIQNRTRGDDDGRFDRLASLAFTPFTVCLFRRGLLEAIGLLDTNYHFFYEDYDMCLRARDAGYRIAFAPRAHVRHKISRTIKGGEGKKTEFWKVYGRSHRIFCRKFRRHRAMTGPLSRLYLSARTLYEGGWSSLVAFREGLEDGRQCDLLPVPAWDAAIEADMIALAGADAAS